MFAVIVKLFGYQFSIELGPEDKDDEEVDATSIRLPFGFKEGEDDDDDTC